MIRAGGWTRRNALAGLGSAAVLAAGMPLAQAQLREVEGFRFENSIRLGGSDLVLNGIGVRRRFYLPIYVAALYVPQRSSDPEVLLSQTGPRRMALRFVREVEAELFLTSLDAGMRKHYAPAQLAAWKEQWDTLSTIISRMVLARRSDHMSWDYTPEDGARLMKNAVPRVPSIASEDFYNAVLRVWLGPQPADADLKKGILAG